MNTFEGIASHSTSKGYSECIECIFWRAQLFTAAVPRVIAFTGIKQRSFLLVMKLFRRVGMCAIESTGVSLCLLCNILDTKEGMVCGNLYPKSLGLVVIPLFL